MVDGPHFPLAGTEPIETFQNGTPIIVSTSELASAPARISPIEPGDHTLSAADSGRIVVSTGSSPSTITVPAGLPLGWQCAIVQGGAGQVTFAAAGGVTLASRQSFTKTAGQYALVSLMHLGGGTHVLLGDAA
jgi:hypothetical protein